MFQFLVEENEKIQKEKLLEEYNDAYPWIDNMYYFHFNICIYLSGVCVCLIFHVVFTSLYLKQKKDACLMLQIFISKALKFHLHNCNWFSGLISECNCYM